jgi:hypothetical protein
MKKIVVGMCLCVIATWGYAQGNPLSFEEVVQEDGKTTKELYTIIKAWAALNFKSANDVIQMDDSENGILIGKGNFTYIGPGGITYRCIDGHVNFTLKAQVKEGRYKITIGDFTHFTHDLQGAKWWNFGLITDREKYKTEGLPDKRWSKTWPDLQSVCKIKAYEIITSIKDATSGANSVIDTKNDNW